MGKQSVTSKPETNQVVDYKEIAWEIMSGPVFEMCRPLEQLKAIAEMACGCGTSDLGLETERFIGLGNILEDIAGDWQTIKEAAKKIHESHKILDPQNPS
jgi:hypothetical protein